MGSCSFLTIIALIRTLSYLIGSRLVGVLRSAKPAEIRCFSSFLITTFFFITGVIMIIRVIRIISIDSLGVGKGESGYQATTIII
jgi:hypothetical protein